jgi:hypothetical protein
MDLSTENLPVVCVNSNGRVRGRIRPRPRPEPTDEVTLEMPLPRDPLFLALYNVTILDVEHRVVKRVPELLVNLRHVHWVMEDDLAPQMDRIKALMAGEDSDAALSELERLLAVTTPDGELLYLAGIVYQNSGAEDRAFDCFSRALQLTLDEKVRSVIKRHIETHE